MLLQRRIVKTLGDQIDIEYLLCRKDVFISFHPIVWMLISVIVPKLRTVPRNWFGGMRDRFDSIAPPRISLYIE
jgi:hypothetical protein